MPYSLPAELYGEIIHAVAQQGTGGPQSLAFFEHQVKNTTLNTLILVNKGFAYYARQHLFSSIEITDQDTHSSLRKLQDILSRAPTSEWYSVPQLVKSVTIFFRTRLSTVEGLIPPFINILTAINTYSPALSSLRILSSSRPIGSAEFGWFQSRALGHRFVATLLNLMHRPTLRKLAVQGFESLPISCISNPHLESLYIDTVTLGNQFDRLLPPASRQSQFPPEASDSNTSAQPRLLTSLALGELAYQRIDDTKALTSDFDVLVHALRAYAGQPSSLGIPFFPRLTSITWKFQRPARQFRASNFTIESVARDAPILRTLAVTVGTTQNSAFPPLADLHSLTSLRTLKLAIHCPDPMDTPIATSTSQLQQKARWAQDAVEGIGADLWNLTLSFNVSVNPYRLRTQFGDSEPWISYDSDILEAWTILAGAIAECPAKRVEICPTVTLPRSSAKEEWVEGWQQYREGCYAKIAEVFQHVSSGERVVKYLPYRAS